MITVRARFYPTIGKEAEVRDFLAEWVKSAQAQGEKAGLAARIFSSEGSALIVPRRFDDVAAADARRRENQADRDWQGRVAKVNTMLRAPILQSIEETVVQPVPSDTEIGAVQRAFVYPAGDKVGAVRSILEQFVRDAHATGRGGLMLSQQVFSETGPLLVLTATDTDVAALDQRRRERAATIQDMVQAIAPLVRAPIAVRLLQVVVPLPR